MPHLFTSHFFPLYYLRLPKRRILSHSPDKYLYVPAVQKELSVFHSFSLGTFYSFILINLESPGISMHLNVKAGMLGDYI